MKFLFDRHCFVFVIFFSLLLSLSTSLFFVYCFNSAIVPTDFQPFSSVAIFIRFGNLIPIHCGIAWAWNIFKLGHFIVPLSNTLSTFIIICFQVSAFMYGLLLVSIQLGM